MHYLPLRLTLYLYGGVCAVGAGGYAVFAYRGAAQAALRFRLAGGYYGIRGDGHGLIRFRYAAPAAFVKFIKFHLFADEHAVLLFNGGKELGKFNSVLHGECKFLLICGHIFLCAAVNYAHLFNAHALCRAGCVHCRVAAAYNRDRIAQGERFGRVLGAV